MGYTHYFPQSRPFTDAEWHLVHGMVNLLISRSTRDLIRGPMGDGEAIVDDGEIAFNGNAETGDDYESFVVTKQHNPEFNFCKTAHRAYDNYVVAVLCLIQRAVPGVLLITSDGGERDWKEGLQLALTIDKDCTVPPAVLKGDSDA